MPCFKIQDDVPVMRVTVQEQYPESCQVTSRCGSEQWGTQEFCSPGGGLSTNSVEDRGQRELGSGGCSPLVKGSGGSCKLVQEISFHIVKFFLIFSTLRLFMMTTNLFVIANVKQLRT